MTRLKSDDLSASIGNMAEYNKKMHEILGCGYFELASFALGINAQDMRKKAASLRVGIVPVSSGEGIISGFSELLSETAEFLGFRATVFPPDGQGFALAKEGRCDIMLWADDDTYLAENLYHAFAAENGWATGLGFAAALDLLCKKHHCEKKVLILGAGPVGCSAAQYLDKAGFQTVLCDKEYEKSVSCAKQLKNCLPIDTDSLGKYAQYQCVLDATPADTRNVERFLAEKVYITAPCVPCHWSAISERLDGFWHDPLQLGTSVMLLSAASLVR